MRLMSSMVMSRKWPEKMWVAMRPWMRPYAQSFVVRMGMKDLIFDHLALVLRWTCMMSPRRASMLLLLLLLAEV